MQLPPTITNDIERAFDAGWVLASKWAERDDLHADMNSPAYQRQRATLLAEIAEAAALSGREAVAWGFYDRLGHLRIQKSSARQYANRTMFPLYTTPQSGDWVVVPREPTEAMLDAALRLQGDGAFLAKAPAVLSAFGKIYRAMIAAAPSAEGVANG